jgi:hypothetical protein
MSTGRMLPVLLVASLGLGPAARAQDGGLDPEQVALAYHRLANEALDLARVAQASDAVRRASNFDRPDVLKAEIARLQGVLAAVNPAQEFTTRVNDHISEYDHARAEFSITLFTPGYYLPVQAFGQEYQVVFANAGSLKAIPMAKEEARGFDERLNGMNRGVINEVRFRITGKGDPAGAVTGARVARAEILSARILDHSGNVLFTPSVAAGAPVTAGAGSTAPGFDAGTADVSGFRVGVKGKDLEATLVRLFGPVSRRPAAAGVPAGVSTVLSVNEMGCMTIMGRRNNPEPGAVCVLAMLDGDDMVRQIRVERLFRYMDAEVFRSALVRKYGEVADAQGGAGGYALGWGPPVNLAAAGSPPVMRPALTATYAADDDMMTRGGNALPRILITLQLVDAEWASRQSK